MLECTITDVQSSLVGGYTSSKEPRPAPYHNQRSTPSLPYHDFRYEDCILVCNIKAELIVSQ